MDAGAELRRFKVPSSPTYEVYCVDARDIDFILSILRESRRTGTLTVHLSQGSPYGQMEWKEKRSPA